MITLLKPKKKGRRRRGAWLNKKMERFQTEETIYEYIFELHYLAAKKG